MPVAEALPAPTAESIALEQITETTPLTLRQRIALLHEIAGQIAALAEIARAVARQDDADDWFGDLLLATGHRHSQFRKTILGSALELLDPEAQIDHAIVECEGREAILVDYLDHHEDSREDYVARLVRER